jgi:hypothetical protein
MSVPMSAASRLTCSCGARCSGDIGALPTEAQTDPAFAAHRQRVVESHRDVGLSEFSRPTTSTSHAANR